ncbi:plastocyanin/azurin family copper-binding protein [Haladaptatus sp. GCM10025707]|uniref:plastocyanin/azurin family copper-binding protein n=1 Tax=unclassified Haladaptatus TaxID=2622732 RepID=UPI0034E94BA3
MSKYACEPHRAQGMKGAVVVGDVFEGVYDLSPVSLSVFGGLGMALLSPLAFGLFLRLRGDRKARHRY